MLAGLRFETAAPSPPPSSSSTAHAHSKEHRERDHHHKKHSHKHKRKHHHRHRDEQNEESPHSSSDDVDLLPLPSSSSLPPPSPSDVQPQPVNPLSPAQTPSTSPPPQRDSWMMAGVDLGSNRLREERDRRRRAEQDEQDRKEREERQRQEEKEARKVKGGLWSMAGHGEPKVNETSSVTVGDGGDGGDAGRARGQKNSGKSVEDKEKGSQGTRGDGDVEAREGEGKDGDQARRAVKRSERLGFRRPDPHDPLTVTRTINRSPSPDSASSTSSTGSRSSWRERVKERRGEGEGHIPRSQSAASPPPPLSTLREGEPLQPRQQSALELSTSTVGATRFAGLEDPSFSLPLSSTAPPVSMEESLSSVPPPSTPIAAPPLSPDELKAQINRVAAKALKAKLTNDIALYDKLQAELTSLKSQSPSNPSPSLPSSSSTPLVLPSLNEHDHQHNGVIILSQLDAFDRPITLPSSSHPSPPLPRHHVQKMVKGERMAYRDDDLHERFTVQELLEKERVSREDDDSRYDAVYGKNLMKRTRYKEQGLDEQFDELDDTLGLYQSKRSKMNEQEKRAQMEQRQRRESSQYDDLIAKCAFCPSSSHFLPSLLITQGQHLYLTLPRYGVVSDSHCLISSIEHTVATADWDESLLTELSSFKRQLASLYSPSSHLITIETVIHFKRRRHTVVHCVELNEEEWGEVRLVMAKAMEESEGEWAVHRKVMEVKGGAGGGVGRVIPKGFPYFVVEFGGEGGYVHVIEKEEEWEEEFGLEVVRGMKGMMSRGGKRGAGGRQSQEEESARVKRFRERWKSVNT